MVALCAFDTHSSSAACAFNAHDFSVRLLHYAGMDIEWFKSRKKARGLTDATLAEAVGVERSVMNRWMNGKVGLDAYKADRVATLLDATPEEILYRAGVPIRDPAASWLPNATVLTTALAMLLDSVGVDPYEDERARKLARQFPNALRAAADLRSDLDDDDDSPLEVSPHGPDAGPPKS